MYNMPSMLASRTWPPVMKTGENLSAVIMQKLVTGHYSIWVLRASTSSQELKMDMV